MQQSRPLALLRAGPLYIAGLVQLAPGWLSFCAFTRIPIVPSGANESPDGHAHADSHVHGHRSSHLHVHTLENTHISMYVHVYALFRLSGMGSEGMFQ
jgi:hypothetical protein